MNMRMKHLFVPDVRLHDGAFPKHVWLVADSRTAIHIELLNWFGLAKDEVS
jgi:hypothetical protein